MTEKCTFARSKLDFQGVSIIFPFYGNCSHRVDALLFILEDYLVNTINTTIIVAEQESLTGSVLKDNPKFQYLRTQYRFRHLCLKNNKLGKVNKGWTLNCAVKWDVSDSPYIGYLDADTYYLPETYASSIEYMVDQNRKWADSIQVLIPAQTAYDLTESDTNRFIQDRHLDFYSLTLPRFSKCGPCQIFSKQAFHKLKGFPENIEGWGAEDDIMEQKLRLINDRVVCLHQFGLHFYHPPSSRDKVEYGSHKEEFLKFYNAACNDIQGFIDKVENYGEHGKYV